MAYKNKEDAYKYNNTWISEHKERINLVVNKGDKERIKERAAKNGENVNAYINRLIREDMDKSETSL